MRKVSSPGSRVRHQTSVFAKVASINIYGEFRQKEAAISYKVVVRNATTGPFLRIAVYAENRRGAQFTH